MKRTLDNTATAKHIAKDSGLVFAYNRSARVWELAPRHAEVRHMRTYAPSEIADIETDSFYEHCAEVAALNMSPEQMDALVIRAQYAAMSDRLANGEQFAPNSPESLEFVRLACGATCADRQVWTVEHVLYNLAQDAEELSGTYADHKRAFLVGAPSIQAEEVAPHVPQFSCVAAYWTDGKPSQGLGKNKGRPTAIGYFENKQGVMSFPARLNGGRIPELEAVPSILAGVTVAAACREFNLKRADLVAASLAPRELRELVARVVRVAPGARSGVALSIVGNYFVMWCGPRSHRLEIGATSPARLFAHWRGFLANCANVAPPVLVAAPRVSLVKPEEAAPPVLVAAPGAPVESNADLMARAVAFVRGRRLAEEARNACECHQCAVPVAGLDDGADDIAH